MRQATDGSQPRKQRNVPPPSGDNLFTRCFTMSDPLGFHARPAALFATTAQQFDAEILVSKKGHAFVNGKSFMGLLTLGIRGGELFSVAATGHDAAAAISALEELFAHAFSQPELDPVPRPDSASMPAPLRAPWGQAPVYA